jgi:hypothetical protein
MRDVLPYDRTKWPGKSEDREGDGLIRGIGNLAQDRVDYGRVA